MKIRNISHDHMEELVNNVFNCVPLHLERGRQHSKNDEEEEPFFTKGLQKEIVKFSFMLRKNFKT